MSVPCFLWSSTRFRYVFWLQILLRAKNFLMEENSVRGDAATPMMARGDGAMAFEPAPPPSTPQPCSLGLVFTILISDSGFENGSGSMPPNTQEGHCGIILGPSSPEC